ncbi:MAG: hypothetical protein R3222_08375 [Balneolaceae bacterium]|nr:hypothetical protein [Balneolaceae bacterium]
MNTIKIVILPIVICLLTNPVYAQQVAETNARLVGGPCQGCEAVLDFGDRDLSPVDTLPGFKDNEPKIKVTGTVYQSDGKTPAEGVIIFVHQTNRKGKYPKHGDEEGWERQYGYIHGWVKTGADGKYTFYTFRPGSYSRNPAHIHPIILEPNGKYYWLGSYFFADDPLLSQSQRNPESPRGGSSGVLTLEKHDGLWVGRRDFILGKNIPRYE